MNQRQQDILNTLKQTDRPISASALAGRFDVSRQIIVSDVALLRAAGEEIVATSRGYLPGGQTAAFPWTGTLVCRHSADQLKDELYAIVDLGGTVIDVSIDHPIYGELSGRLDLSSRFDVDEFLSRVSQEGALPISSLTSGLHLHRIGCKDRDVFERIRARLVELDIAR
ncbi:MAG: transcription repressor NadR [Firmicutes bacterium]|nr:transcription repressor NadR [Bacillota bacterium]